MNTPGSILKTEREKQNRSLKDISTDLKIKTEYLKALEEDNYEVLPAEIYTKSYLRLYADTLHINNDHLLDLYKNLTKPAEPEGDDASAKKKNDLDFSPASLVISDSGHKSSALRKLLNYKTVLMIAVVALIVALIFIITDSGEEKKVLTAGSADQKTAVPAVNDEQKAVMRKGSDNKKTSSAVVSDQKKAAVTAGSDKQKTAPAVVSDQKKAAASADSDKQKAAAATINKVADTPASESKTTGKLSLKVLATETTWISARIDGSPRREWSI